MNTLFQEKKSTTTGGIIQGNMSFGKIKVECLFK